MGVRSTRWLLCVFVILAGNTPAGERPWRMASTPHYQVISQLDDRDTTYWMRRFDQFILSTTDILHMDLRALPPLTVIIFDRDKDYAPYKLTLPSGRTANVAGEFIRRPTWSLIGMAYEGENEQLHATLQHEATHWLMSGDQSRQPAWFTEGIAEMFSTFDRRVDKVQWAKPIGAHLELLRTQGSEPLAQFLTEPGALFEREDHTERFYAESWAFTHFLQVFREQSGGAAVTAVFGTHLPDIEHDFHLYIDQHRFGYLEQPVKPAADPPPLQAAPPALVEASLGFLALGSMRYELAQQHAA